MNISFSICSTGSRTQTLQTPGKHPTIELYNLKIEYLDYQMFKLEVGLGSYDEGC